MANQLDECMRRGCVPEWMTTGCTVMLVKDIEKGNNAGNYRPITCLPLMWKLVISIIADLIYELLERTNLLPEQQKVCRRNSRGTKDQLLIDNAIMKNCKRRMVGLSMIWIDYKKAYDMLPHSWIQKTLQMCGIAMITSSNFYARV